MICSVSMEPFATSRRELARVQKVGQVPIAAKELVTINFTALDALKSARALPTTPNCKKLVWCLGRTSLYPIFSYDHVRCHPWTGECICKEGWDGQTCSRPCPTYTFGLGCRNVCTCKNDAHCDPVNGTCVCLSGIDPPPSLVRSIIVLASILFLFFRSVPFHKQQQATSATTARIPVQRGFTDTIVPTSALVKTEATAQIRTDNANVLSDGPVSCVNLRAGPAFTGRIARSNVTVKTELLAITWLVSPVHPSSSFLKRFPSFTDTLQANVRVAPDLRTTHAMPPVRKAVSVWIARRRASARKERPKLATPSLASASVTQITAESDARLSALKVDTVRNVVMFAIARTTALATTWATVSVNADGRENCARIRVLRVFRLLLFYNDNDFFKLFFFFQVSMARNAASPARLASMVIDTFLCWISQL